MVAALSYSLLTAAQSGYPEKAVRIIVSSSPGTASDITARLAGQRLGEVWGKPVVIENMPGAGGSIAAAHVARAAPDGHTLLMSGDAAMTTNVTLYEKLSYDPVRDFIPISMAVLSASVLVVPQSSPVRNVQELVKLAKSEPGKLTYASPGIGTSAHLGGELLEQMAGIDLIHVPYTGVPAAVQDIVGGRVTMGFAAIVNALPLIKDGKLRGLAVSSRKRWPALPDLPTMSEAGFPGFEAVAWFGLLTPAGTPNYIVQKIHQDTVKVLTQSDVRAKLENAGLEVIGNSPQEFAAQIKEEIVRKGKLVKTVRVKPE